MLVKKESFVIPMSRRATSSNTFTAKTSPWHPNDVVVIDAISVSIDAHKTKTVHVGVSRSGYAVYLETLLLSIDGAFFCTKAAIVVPSGYRVIVKCVSPTAGVLYTINVFGHIELECKE